MKVLIICSGNNSNRSNFQFEQNHVFIHEQVKNIEELGVYFDYFFIEGKGLIGYLKNVSKLSKFLQINNFDILHAHYGASGLVAIFQKKVPVLITYHGSDINLWNLNILSSIIAYFSTWRIFVSNNLSNKILYKPSYNNSIIPCGVNFNIFYPIDKYEARKRLSLDINKLYVLFASSFDIEIKNFPLAQKAIEIIEESIEIIELKNKTREEVNLLLNACDLLLLTSKSEGSPQVIKEALASNCPIVATDVGNIKEMLEGVSNCFVVKPNPKTLAEKINLIFNSNIRTNGREIALKYDNKIIAKLIYDIYQTIALTKDYQICTKTLIDTTVPGVVFDELGVSNYCKIYENLALQYPRGNKGFNDWLSIVSQMKKNKKKKYDCIIGVSGGTDSSYLMHIAVKNGLRPLAVNLDNGWNSETSYSNIKKITTKLNIDLETYVIDYEEIKDLFVSYMKASLPWIDNPTDIAIQSILFKIANKENINHILIGNDFRTEGKQPTEWTYSDTRQLKYLHKKYGKTKLQTYPRLKLSELYYLSTIKKIKMLSVFHYIDYNKKEAQEFLKKEYDWEYYGEHHHENLFTKFTISYWLPKKFNIDKRIITYSAQILSGEITREFALNKIKGLPYDENEMERDKEYVIKKLGISSSEFEEMMKKPNKTFMDYPSHYPLIKRFAKIIMPFASLVLKVKPKMFFEMEVRNKR